MRIRWFMYWAATLLHIWDTELNHIPGVGGRGNEIFSRSSSVLPDIPAIS
jgi:hypothetical protein